MGNKLYIAGVGPGDKELITPMVRKLIETCDVLIGGKRNLEVFSNFNKEKLIISNNLEEVYEYIAQNIACKRIAVLVTGDPGIYSIMRFLKQRLQGVEMEVLPGISSLQYLCSRIHESWNDMYITSVHGRQQASLMEIIHKNSKVAIFTGGDHTPGDICRKIVQQGLEDLTVTVGEKLSYPEERVVTGTPEEIGDMRFDSLSIMIVQKPQGSEFAVRGWGFSTPGIPDNMFIRGNVPMTKEEVRTVSLSKLRLESGSIVYDVGAGTGSVSVECALISSMGTVYAFEKDSEGLELIKRNSIKFGVSNIEAVEGEAPIVFEGMPVPDRIFIGGTGGNLDAILDWIKGRCEAARVVINTVTIESTYEAVQGLEAREFENVEVVSVSVARSRKVGGKHLMQAINPVYIISADKTGLPDS